ncbi:hypothetical protein [Kitasatospora sp. CB02891]|uniref:hypothetical protein n=1 Tax=Kitasatospora sp. CB02891 TaxID=2020329 RepID=UPI000C27ED42|nr:hypothetical protein [Kitasatospora sp. CB02891]PJN24074.1 hypothetical protein CG736_19455 [Kitasatospora sp. CB02891]
MPRILGREPALWLTLVAVLVKLGSAFGLHVSTDQQALINAAAAALVGLVVALIVGDGRGAAVLGLVQAALALAVGYGLHWTADQQAVALSAVAAAVAMWTRTQVTAPVPAARQLPPIPAVRE